MYKTYTHQIYMCEKRGIFGLFITSSHAIPLKKLGEIADFSLWPHQVSESVLSKY